MLVDPTLQRRAVPGVVANVTETSRASEEGLPAGVAFSLLFLVPGVALALTFGIVAATFGLGKAAFTCCSCLRS
jgi:hypothetical protein